MPHLDLPALEAGLDHVRSAPGDGGRLELIVRRPVSGEREVLEEATLDVDEGLVGDRWAQGSHGPDGTVRPPNPQAQLTLMNARAAALVAGTPERRPLAGDQLYVDLDLSGANLPPGTRLAIGTAVVEITDEPHTGCRKFHERFGNDALRLTASPLGRELNLRGVNARIVAGGTVRRGDTVAKTS